MAGFDYLNYEPMDYGSENLIPRCPPPPGFEQQIVDYGSQDLIGYCPPNYEQQNSLEYGHQIPDYDPQNQNYGSQNPVYGQTVGDYGQQVLNYCHPKQMGASYDTSGYGSQNSNYDQIPPGYDSQNLSDQLQHKQQLCEDYCSPQDQQELMDQGSEPPPAVEILPGRMSEWRQWNYMEEMRRKDFEKVICVLEHEKDKRNELEKSLWEAESRLIHYLEKCDALDKRKKHRDKAMRKFKESHNEKISQLDDMRADLSHLNKKIAAIQRGKDRVASKEAKIMDKQDYLAQKRALKLDQRYNQTTKCHLEKTISIKNQLERNRLYKIAKQKQEIEELEAEWAKLQKIRSRPRKD